MSQLRNLAPDQPPSSSNDGQSKQPTSTGVRNAAESNHPPPREYRQTDSRPDEAMTVLPPLRSRSNSGSNPTRLGMHQILNPSHSEPHEQRGRRRSAAQMESSSSAEATPPTPPIPMHRPSSVESSYSDISPSGGPLSARRGLPRRILTPRSPTLHRTTSVGLIGPTTGTIDAHQSPFLPGGPGAAKSHSIEPGSAGLPSLPTTTIQRQTYTVPAQAPTPPMPHRRQSVGAVPLSASASPSLSSASYAQSSIPSPGTPYPPSTGPTPPTSYQLQPSPGAGGLSSIPTVSLDVERPQYNERQFGVPVVSMGQGNVQLMTYITPGGQHVPLPVDVQAASRQADEKRKRNAGASARFRARRKEKEREATTTISRLEAQLRDATEDMEFYKRECRELVNILYKLPNTQQHFPRPNSPRHHRPSRATSTSGDTGSVSASVSPSYPTYVESNGRGETERNTRRRTDSYSLPPPTSNVQAQPSFPPSPYAPMTTRPQQETQRFGAPQSSGAPLPQPYSAPAYERSWPPQGGPEGR